MIPLELQKAILSSAQNNRLSCSMAFQLAQHLNIEPIEIGGACDRLDIKLVRCQLGLFGHDDKKRLVSPQKEPDAVLRDAIINALVNKRLPCITAWSIALRLGLARPEISVACDALNIKIGPCQLGAF